MNKFSNKYAMGCIFSKSDDAGVGEDEIEGFCELVSFALDEGKDSTVHLTARNTLSIFEFEELKECIENNCNNKSVRYETDHIKVKTIDGSNVAIFMIFGGTNIAKKMGLQKPRESIESLGSLGSFEDITGQGLTQATMPFYEFKAEPSKLDDLDEEDDYSE